MEAVRDWLLVALFLETFITLILLIIVIVQVWQLVRLLRGEVMPILDTVRRTTNTVQGTAEFVSETTVRPLIRAASAMAAATRFVRAFFGLTRGA